MLPAILAAPYVLEGLVVLTGLTIIMIQQNGPQIASAMSSGADAVADGIENIRQQIMAMSASEPGACESCSKEDQEESSDAEEEAPGKKSVEGSQKGDKVRSPDTHKGDFEKLRNGQGYRNNNTGETWQKSHTSHKGDAWKVFDKKGNRIGSVKSDGTIVGD